MPELHWRHLTAAAVCFMLGRQEEARTAIDSLRKYNPTLLDLGSLRDDRGMWIRTKMRWNSSGRDLQKAGLKYGSADSVATEMEPKLKSDPTAPAR